MIYSCAKATCLASSLVFGLTGALWADSLTDQGVDFGASYEAGFQLAPIGSDAGGSSKQRLTLNLAVDMEKLLALRTARFLPNTKIIMVSMLVGIFLIFSNLMDSMTQNITVFICYGISINLWMENSELKLAR